MEPGRVCRSRLLVDRLDVSDVYLPVTSVADHVATDCSMCLRSPTLSSPTLLKILEKFSSLPSTTLHSLSTTRMLCSTLLLVSPFDFLVALRLIHSDVYALEVAGGGDACIGHIGHDHSGDAHASSSAAPAASSSAASSAAAPAVTSAAAATSADIPAPPAESTGCVLHDDHYHCEGPAAATSAAAAPAAEQTGDCHTHADGGK